MTKLTLAEVEAMQDSAVRCLEDNGGDVTAQQVYAVTTQLAAAMRENAVLRERMERVDAVVVNSLTDCCADAGAREACRTRKHFGEQIDPDDTERGYDLWEAECNIDDSPSECAYHAIFDALLPLPTPEYPTLAALDSERIAGDAE